MNNEVLIMETNAFVFEKKYFNEAENDYFCPVTNDDNYNIFILLDGNISYRIGGDFFPMKVNYVAISPPYSPHAPIYPKKIREGDFFSYIEFSFRLSADKRFDGIRKFLDKRNIVTISDSRELIRWEHMVVSCFDLLKKEEFACCANGFVTQFVFLFFHLYNRKKSETHSYLNRHELIENVTFFIKQNLVSIVSLSDVAAKFHVNPSYLSRLFKNDVGISFTHYVLIQRLALAKVLIEEGERSMNAAKKAGFNDYSYFYKKFKDKYSVSPKQCFISAQEKRAKSELPKD